MQSSTLYLQLQINLVTYRLHLVITGIEILCHFVASEEEEEEKLSEFPLQKYLQKECIQLKKGKDFSVGEE